MKRILFTFIVVVTSVVPTTNAHAQNKSADLPPMHQRRKFQLAPKFVERLAWCETHGDWKNGGNFSGGFGIALSTWRGFGGSQFAKTPSRATKEEQIIVANRIALWGFTRRDKRFQFPVGLSGWGGLDCARPVKLVTRRIPRSHAFSAHEEADPYRQAQTKS